MSGFAVQGTPDNVVRFVDIHTHLIPDLDDGATSLLETLEMLRYSYDRGTRAISTLR